MKPSVKIVARTLFCDAADGETVLPDYKVLKKLLKRNLRALKIFRNKTMVAAMHTGKMHHLTKETTFAGKMDLEILTMIDDESKELIEAYERLIAAVKAAAQCSLILSSTVHREKSTLDQV